MGYGETHVNLCNGPAAVPLRGGTSAHFAKCALWRLDVFWWSLRAAPRRPNGMPEGSRRSDRPAETSGDRGENVRHPGCQKAVFPHGNASGTISWCKCRLTLCREVCATLDAPLRPPASLWHPVGLLTRCAANTTPKWPKSKLHTLQSVHYPPSAPHRQRAAEDAPSKCRKTAGLHRMAPPQPIGASLAHRSREALPHFAKCAAPCAGRRRAAGQ